MECQGLPGAWLLRGKPNLQLGISSMLIDQRQFNKLGKAFQIQTLEGMSIMLLNFCSLLTLSLQGPMVVLNAKQSEEVGSLPDHIVDNMRPNGRVRGVILCSHACTEIG